MKTHIRKLWMDESGFLQSTESVLFGTILILGSIVGLVTLRDHIVQEFGDLGSAFGNLDHSYEIEGFDPPGDAFVAGSEFEDRSDFCELGDGESDDNGDNPNVPPGCINVLQAPSEE